MISKSSELSTAICLIIFRAHMNILFVIELKKIFLLIKWSPQSFRVLSPKRLAYFEHVARFPLNDSTERSTFDHIPFKSRHPNYCNVWFRCVYLRVSNSIFLGGLGWIWEKTKRPRDDCIFSPSFRNVRNWELLIVQQRFWARVCVCIYIYIYIIGIRNLEIV
jgi:hypothetical protein